MPAKKTITLEISPSQMVEGLDAMVGELVEKKFAEFVERTQRTRVMTAPPRDCQPQELSDRAGFWFDVEAARKFDMPFQRYHEYRVELLLTRLGTWIEHGIPNLEGSKPTTKEYWKEISTSIALHRIKQEFDIEPGELDRFGALREV